jgi:hypothetical protein
MVSKIPPKATLNGEGDFYRSLQEWGSHNAALVETRLGRDVLGLGADSKALFVAYWAILNAVQAESCELA